MAGRVGRSMRSSPGVPDDDLCEPAGGIELYDANTVYAAFDNHKNEDFKPYLLKSTRRGQDVDFDCGESAGEWSGAGVCGRYGECRTCCLRGRSSERSLRLTAASHWVQLKGRSADDCGARHGDSGARRRSGDCDVWARILCAGRYFSAAADEGGIDGAERRRCFR